VIHCARAVDTRAMVYPAQSFVALAGSEVKKILQVMFTTASNMLLFDDAGQRAVGGVRGWLRVGTVMACSSFAVSPPTQFSNF
jgi:hypothetical protein